MSLKGGPELRARLKALKLAFKPVGKSWAQETASLARASAPRRTGKLAGSIRVKNASQRKATVSAVFYGHILDTGAAAHDITAKGKTLRFEASGQTIFSKKVHKPRQAGTGFATRAARRALDKAPLAQALIDEWNGAA